jgi:hypothetical protein
VNYSRKTIIEHKDVSGVIQRWCMKCGIHLDSKGEIDQDFYSYRKYLKLMEIPFERRCNHSSEASRNATNEELKIMIGNVNMTADFRNLLCAIIERLP